MADCCQCRQSAGDKDPGRNGTPHGGMDVEVKFQGQFGPCGVHYLTGSSKRQRTMTSPLMLPCEHGAKPTRKLSSPKFLPELKPDNISLLPLEPDFASELSYNKFDKENHVPIETTPVCDVGRVPDPHVDSGAHGPDSQSTVPVGPDEGDQILHDLMQQNSQDCSVSTPEWPSTPKTPESSQVAQSPMLSPRWSILDEVSPAKEAGPTTPKWPCLGQAVQSPLSPPRLPHPLTPRWSILDAYLAAEK